MKGKSNPLQIILDPGQIPSNSRSFIQYSYFSSPLDGQNQIILNQNHDLTFIRHPKKQTKIIYSVLPKYKTRHYKQRHLSKKSKDHRIGHRKVLKVPRSPVYSGVVLLTRFQFQLSGLNLDRTAKICIGEFD